MSYLRFQSEYDRFPQHSVSGFDEEAWRGWEKITQAIRERTREQKTLIADCYPGVNDDEILPMLNEAQRQRLLHKIEKGGIQDDSGRKA